ncbi:MAG: HAMP domain-containing sensor histidine kinase, partial [Acidimicrobiia bacterium]
YGRVTDTEGEELVNLVGGPLYLNDQLIGVAVAGQSMEALYEVTSDTTGLAGTGETILAQETAGEIVPISPLRVDGVELEPGEVQVLDSPLLDNAVTGVETATTEATDYHGHSVVAFSRHIDGADWGMVVLQRSNEIVNPLNKHTAVIGSAVVIGILLAFFAARRVANSIAAPLVQVAENAQQVTQGRRDLTVETEYSEITRLVDSFNTMVKEMDGLTGDLEQKIEKRTEELETKNAELQKVMDDKEVFLAGVSHELRSPITAMIGFIDIVNMSGEELDPDERAEMLETVSSQATDVLNLIEDLLASARAQAGTLKMAAVRVNLAAQARQVIEATSASSRKTVTYTGGEGNAVGDPARVRQIVRNLVTNAFRYGGSEIEVEVLVDGNVAILEVKDNGEGIAVDALEKIFEAYGQADTSSVADSVGLGLHVSRNLARLMGGDLDYEYRDGWSVFSLRLLQYVEEESRDDTQPIVVSLGNE